MQKDQVALIGVDWGTTAFRAYLIGEDGGALDQIESNRGILSLKAGEHESALAQAIKPWRNAGDEPPILLSGMIGSRQGWREAPYVRCPAGLSETAAAMATINTATLGKIAIVPGILDAGAAEGPDVMRGEETQIFGALAATKKVDGRFVLPGTHSKWAKVKAGRIVSFRTYMTGEVFAALRNHTILGRLMEAGEADREGFIAGVRAAEGMKTPGDLLHGLFMTRTLGLFEKLRGAQLSDYLSGLLVAAEIIAATDEGGQKAGVIGSPSLAKRYVEAGAILGLQLEPAPDHCVALGQRALLGEWLKRRSAD